MPTVERQLLEIDRRLFRRLNVARRVERAPRAVLEALEMTYILCYPLVPAGFLTLVIGGHEALADRYWTTVLTAEMVSYGMLPWIQTRPPRSVDPDTGMDRRGLVVRRLNLWILGRGSIQVNTLPSGHAAGATAVALAVSAVLPLPGAVFLALALSIVIASVAGRYHYAVDSIAGVLVGVIAWLLVWS